MKILAIRGRNIASLDGEFEMDFTCEPLKSAGIFAISGPTGAGKSTLLDAMCLALFARTPRTDQAKENEVWLKDVKDSALTQGDPRNLLRRGTAAGYAEADFVALNGQRYRARWGVRRARDKESGALQNFKLSLINLDTGKEEQGNRKDLQLRIVELIGLTFDQFTRSVLLAQNDFSTFLKADQSEKASLLEKLTGTESFSIISQLIYQKNAQAKEAYEQIRSHIEGVELLTDDDVQQLTASRQQAEEAIQLLNKEKVWVERQQNWFKELDLLSENVRQARNEIVLARQTWEHHRQQAAYLDLVVQVQGARSVFDAEKNACRVYEEKQQQLLLIKEQAGQSLQRQENARILYMEQLKEQEDIEKQYKALESHFLEARNLDVRIEEISSRLKETEARFNKALFERKENESRNRKIDESLKSISSEIAMLEEWQEKHRSREHVAEQISVLQIQLDSAEAARNNTDVARKQIEELQVFINNQDKLLQERQNTAVTKNKLLQQIEESLTSLEWLQKEVSIETLRKEISIAREQKEMLVNAARCWQDLYKLQNELTGKNKRLAENRIYLTETASNLEKGISYLHTTSSEKKQAERIYNNAMLAVAGNVEEMRSRLEVNQPCPVCGSTSHPYVGTDERLHLALASIEEEVKKLSLQYDEALKETERLKQTIKNLSIEIEKQQEEIKILNVQEEKLKQGWSAYPFLECDEIEPERREHWFVTALENIATLLAQQQQKEVRYSERQQEIQKLMQERMTLHRELTALNKEADEFVANKKLADNKLATQQIVITEQGKMLASAILAINDLFGNEKWQKAWIEDAADFRKKLVDFATRWQGEKERLRQKQTQLERLQAEQKAILSFLPSLLKEEQECGKKFELQQQQLTSLKKERSGLLNGRPVMEVEEEFKNRLEIAKNRLSDLLVGLNNASHIYEQNKGTASQIERDLQTAVSEVGYYKQQLEEWLVTFNADRLSPLTYKDLTELLSKDSTWIQAERNVINRMNSDLVAAQAKLQEREEKLRACDNKRKELEINEATPESLQTLLDNISQQIERQNTLLTECIFRLRRQEENKAKVKGLEEELKAKKTISEQWAKLNDLAGSSDGGKFRRIAQRYTLDILLEYANVQLRSLSARYRLERVPDTLALQVIDRDMCDEIRTVHSLSGGESFLVSLALALGLSSLSSNRMKVESLFIDEGFGSLDADTLRVAMDALESLRMQGRKIGVISHVQEMTERIPVRINVEKMGNGKSVVSVTG